MRSPSYWVAAAVLAAACRQPPTVSESPDAALPPAVDAPLGGHYAPAVPGQRAEMLSFRVRSQAATRIEVELYDQALLGEPVSRHLLTRSAASDVWSVTVPSRGTPETLYYGYRAWGPNWDFDPRWTPGSAAGFVVDVDNDGNRFNPNKLLIDPYARELSHDPVNSTNQAYKWFRTGEADRAFDSGPYASKGIVLRQPNADDEPPDLGRPQHRAFRDEIIYEVHLRGFTRADPKAECPGTYKAAGARAEYLARLGISAVEFLPVHETQNQQNDLAEGADGDNYWGYSSLSFFAPDRRYACDQTPGGPTREFREMVKRFHDRGIKVYIDVVYNHTAEGGVGGDGTRTALLSWRGLDNAAYYELADDPARYHDSTGIGANVNAANPLVRDLVIDSLRYWSEDMGVDGFRFDLATVLGNGCDRGCFRWQPDDPDNILNRAVAELPARPASGGPGVDLIAEPWAVEAGTYRLGQFPAGWSQWNDQFRRLLRADQNELDRSSVTPGWLAARFAGSAELFADRGGPELSVNYLVSHDGFNLRDVYSCNQKNNDQPWPFGPSDGGDNHNQSWDQRGDPKRQRQAARTGLALLLMASGVPMLTGGDEMYRRQYCNNNPYNLDSRVTWIDWSDLETSASFHTFAQRLLQFRRAHPMLRRAGYDVPIGWHRADGSDASGPYMDDDQQHFIGFRLRPGDPPSDGNRDQRDSAASIYVAYNGAATPLTITLPPQTQGASWRRAGDTATWMEPYDNFDAPGQEYEMNGMVYDLAPRSVVIFLER